MKTRSYPPAINYQPLFDMVCDLAIKKEVEPLRKIIQEDESINFYIRGISPVMLLASWGEEAAVYFLLENFPEVVPLGDAAKGFAMGGNLPNVRYCMEMGAPLPLIMNGAVLKGKYKIIDSLDEFRVMTGGDVTRMRIHGLAHAGVGMEVLQPLLPYYRDDNVPEFYFYYKCFILQRYARGEHWEKYRALFTDLREEAQEDKDKLQSLYRQAFCGCAYTDNREEITKLIQSTPSILLRGTRGNLQATSFAMIYMYGVTGQFKQINSLLIPLENKVYEYEEGDDGHDFTPFEDGVAQAMRGLANSGYYKQYFAYKALVNKTRPHMNATHFGETGHVKMAFQELGTINRSALSEVFVETGDFEAVYKLPRNKHSRNELIKKIRSYGYFNLNAPLIAMLSRLNNVGLRQIIANEAWEFHEKTFDKEVLLNEAMKLNRSMRKYHLNLPQARAINQPRAITMMLYRNSILRETKFPVDVFNLIVGAVLKIRNHDVLRLYSSLVNYLYNEIWRSKKRGEKFSLFSEPRVEIEDNMLSAKKRRLHFSQ